MPNIDRNGRTLHYDVSGKGSEAILFLNSLGTSLTMWDAQAEALASDFRIIRFDWPGHGKSHGANAESATGSEASIAVLVADALAVLDAAGVQRAHVAGLSLGGLVAQAMALEAPERVASLMLCATSAAFQPPDLWAARAATVLREGMEPMVVASRPRWFTPAFLDAQADVAEQLFATLRAVDPTGYAYCCMVLGNTDLRSRLEGLAVSTLLIAGADDPATPPAKLEEIGKLLQNARLVTLEKAAHILNVEQAEQTTSLIRLFVQSLR